MDDLEEHWKQLNLSSKEATNIIVKEDVLLEELKKGKSSLIEKLHSEHIISKDILRSTMMRAWKTTSSFLVREIQSNSFVFTFDSHTDLLRVLHHKLWLFDNHLISLRPFDGITPPIKKMDFTTEEF